MVWGVKVCDEEAKKDMTINQGLRWTRRNVVNLNQIFLIYRLQIYEYSQQMDNNVEKEISCDVTLKVIDMILLNETSLNKPTVSKTTINILLFWMTDRLSNPSILFSIPFTQQTFPLLCSTCVWRNNKKQQVKKLQELVQLVTINRESASFILPVSSVTNPKSISSSASISPMRQLKSLQIFKANVKNLPFSHQIYG